MCRQEMLVGFFLQAEDGIRDLVRSRGLGDVYKRQSDGWYVLEEGLVARVGRLGAVQYSAVDEAVAHYAVSYTHLTLPTSDLV